MQNTELKQWEITTHKNLRKSELIQTVIDLVSIGNPRPDVQIGNYIELTYWDKKKVNVYYYPPKDTYNVAYWQPEDYHVSGNETEYKLIEHSNYQDATDAIEEAIKLSRMEE